MSEKSKRIKNGTLTFIINLVKNKAYTGIFKGYAEKHVLFCGWRTIAGYSWEVQFGNNYGTVERASLTHKLPSMTQTEVCSSGRPGATSFRLGSSGHNLQGNTLVYPLLRGPDPKTPAPAGGCGGRCKEESPRGARGTGVLCSQGLAPEAGGCKWGVGSRPRGLLSGWVKRGDGDGGEGRWQNWPAIHTPSHRNIVLTWVSWTNPF